MRTIFTGLCSLLAVLGAASAGDAGSCGVAEERLNFLIVRVGPQSTVDAFIAALEADHPGLDAVTDDTIPGRPLFLLELTLPPEYGPPEVDQLELSLKTAYASIINWGEFLYSDEAPEGNTGSTFVDGLANLTLFQTQYAANLTGVGPAQARSVGSGTVVAVLDTGIDDTHPLLAGQVVAGGIDLIDDDADPQDVGDELDNDLDGLTDEMTGHGTFVAGLIQLVAPQARLLPVRVIDSDGNGTLWTLAKGMFHAIDQGVEVINISVSSTYKSQAVEDAVDEAAALGIAVVAAAGNCDVSSPLEWPAMGSTVLGVAATDDQDIKSAVSNYDERVFISAPGASVYGPNGPDPDQSIISIVPGTGYAYWEGTSMATPLVSGAAALIRSQHPEWPAAESTLQAIEDALAWTAQDIDGLNPAYAGQLGAGRLDVHGAVLLGPVAPAPGDLDASGQVGIADLLLLLADWGLTHSSADLDGDGTVGINDLLALLSHWGS